MHKFLTAGLLFGSAALAACSPQQQQVACQVDGVMQPIAAATLASLVPASTPVVAVDTGLIHPAVVNYCASIGGTAVATAAATPTSTAAAPATTPAAASK